MGRLVLCAVLAIVACNRSGDGPTPAPAAESKIADDIARTVDDLARKPPEAIPETAKQAAVAPTALLGTWKIKHLVYIKDGKPGASEPPIVEGTWTFEGGGRFVKGGGNELEGTFVLTKDELIVSTLGLALDYSVDKLTGTELVVTQMILEGTGTTTVLERVR